MTKRRRPRYTWAISCVLFDLDGTLIDTSRLLLIHSVTQKRHLDLGVPTEKIVLTFGRPLVDILAEYSADKADVMLQTYREYNESRHDTHQAYSWS